MLSSNVLVNDFVKPNLYEFRLWLIMEIRNLVTRLSGLNIDILALFRLLLRLATVRPNRLRSSFLAKLYFVGL